YVDASGRYHGFVSDGIDYFTIDFPDARQTFLADINNDGIIVGTFVDNGPSPDAHGFVTNGLDFIILDAPGAISTNLSGLSNTYVLVGNHGLKGSPFKRGFVYIP